MIEVELNDREVVEAPTVAEAAELLRKMGGRLCPFEHGRGDQIATWILPQSTDAGETVTYVVACDIHQEDWWEGADWDGRHLEVRLSEDG